MDCELCKSVQVMITCSVKAFLKYSNIFKCLLQAENSVTGRAYMGEVLIQIWLKSMKK